MALTVTSRGTGTHNTGATTLVPNGRSATLAAGSMGVLCIALDNEGSGGAATIAPASWTDAKGNVWTLRTNALYDNGAASAGIEMAYYTAPITVALLTTDAGTMTWGGGVSPVAKAWTWYEVIPSGGNTVGYSTGGSIAGATAANATVVTSSVLVGDAVIAGYFAENVSAVTGDADSTNGTWAAQQTATVGTTTSGVIIATQQKVQTTTASTQSYDVTVASQDRIAGYVMLHEVVVTTATIGLATLTLTPLTPAVTVSSNTTATIGLATLTLTPLTPVVSTTAGQTATIGTASLTLTRLTPTVTASNHQTAVPGVASLILAPQTPTVRLGLIATVGTTALTLTPLTPTVNVAAPSLTLNIGGVNKTAALKQGTLRSSATDDGAQGVLDFVLIDYAPADNATVVVAAGATTYYSGRVRSKDVNEYSPGHYFCTVSCQDDAVAFGSLGAAPWAFSDTPNGTTTFAYLTLSMRTTSARGASYGGAPEVTGTVTTRKAGLKPGYLLTVTSANHGLSAVAFDIHAVSTWWDVDGTPIYTVSFGDTPVRLVDTLVSQVAGTSFDPASDLAVGLLAPAVVTSLPSLPSATYPEGRLVYLTADDKIYRSLGSSWSKEVDGADLLVASITAGAIQAGAIGTGALAAGAVTAAKITVGGMGGGGNMVANSSFESGTTGWIGGPGPVIDSRTSPAGFHFNGGSSLKFVTHGSAEYVRNDGTYVLQPGHVYTASFWISCMGTGAVAAGVGAGLVMEATAATVGTVFDETGAAVTTYGGGTPLRLINVIPSGWTRYSVTWTQAALQTNNYVLLAPSYGSTYTNEIYFDGIQLEEGAIATSYRPGPMDLRNDPGEVVIDSTGIAVTNGKITVTNAGATVIIDGTSDMFKISASGTLTSAFGAVNSAVTVTLTVTGLGSGFTIPAACIFNTTTDQAVTVTRSAAYRPDVNLTTGVVRYDALAGIYLNTTPGTLKIDLRAASNTVNPGTTATARFYTLIEAGI
jgi:hypothetical protein